MLTLPARAAVVVGTDSCLKVRQKPSLDAAVVDCVPDGTQVPLTAASERDDQYRWAEIVDRGWAVVEYLQRTRAVVSGTASCLNVRETPSTGARVLTCLPEGASVSLAQEAADGWTRVEGAGWVLDDYLD